METLDSTAYSAAVAAYNDLRAQLHVESLAALALLMEAGAPEAMMLLRGLGSDAAIADIVGRAPDRRRPVDDDDEDDSDDEEAEDTANTDVASRLLQAIAPRLRAATRRSISCPLQMSTNGAPWPSGASWASGRSSHPPLLLNRSGVKHPLSASRDRP